MISVMRGERTWSRPAYSGHLSLKVYNVAGRLVSSLVEDPHAKPGSYTVTWHARSHAGHRISPGTYFVRLQAGGETVVRKVVFLGD